jgi:hypothetical protein
LVGGELLAAAKRGIRSLRRTGKPLLQRTYATDNADRLSDF